MSHAALVPAVLLALGVAFPMCSLAQEPPKTPAQALAEFIEEPGQAVAITADVLREDKARKLLIGDGFVEVRYRGMRLHADHVELHTESRDGVALGNVVFETEEDRLVAERMEFNLDSERVTLYQAEGYIGATYFIRGEKVVRLSEDKFDVFGGSLTSCSGDAPLWHFRSPKSLIQVEKYAYLRSPSIWLGGAPVMYLPYAVIPIKAKRATGFLVPEVSVSNRDGFIFRPKFFWAPTRWFDATLGLDYLSKRGFQPNLEVRYKLSPETQGIHNFTYFRDMVLGGEFWKLRSNHTQKLPMAFEGMLVLDIVNRSRLDEEFAEPLEERTRENTDNRLAITRRSGNIFLQLSGLRQDGLREKQDQTFQRLPELTFNIDSEPLGRTPFRFDWRSSFVSFFRVEDRRRTTHQRLDLRPSLSMPYSPAPWINFSPFFAFRETFWTESLAEPGGQVLSNADLSRELWTVGGSINGPRFERVFETPLKFLPGLKHLIQPEVSYTYTPAMDSEDRRHIISIDGVDGIEDENRLGYSLTNRVLGKVIGREGFAMRELLRVSLSQNYDIAEARRTQRREQKRRPFSPVSLDVVSNPSDWAHFSFRSDYNVYSSYVTNWSLNAELNGGKRWYLKAQREWQRDGDQFVTLSAGLSPVRSWFFEAGFRRNTLEDVTLERSLAVHWQGQCCGLGLRLVDWRDKTEVFLTFNLVGVLEGERVPGYTMRYLPKTEEEGISERLRGIMGGVLGREGG